MVTVPKSSRSSTVTVASASAGPWPLGFRLFDDDAIYVYVNGVQRSDWTLARTYTPGGFADDASITFAAALSVGQVLRIDSSLVPDREQDYASGDPNLTRNLNIELARVWAALSDLRRDVDRAPRALGGRMRPFTAAAGAIVAVSDDGTGFVTGPTVQALEAAADGAAEASASAIAAAAEAEAAAAIAQAAEASLIRDAGAWITARAYSPSDLVTQAGSTYICIVPHTSGTFSTDLSANRWRVFAAQGSPGPGSGNMLGSNNLSDLTNFASARTNLQLGAASDVTFGSLLLSGTTPRLALADTTGAPTGAERVDVQADNGVLRMRALNNSDVLAGIISEVAFGSSGATEHRWRIGGSNQALLNTTGLTLAGLLAATRVQWSDPTFVGSAQAITDLNAVTQGGLYYADQTALNSPVAAEGRAIYVLHMPQGSSYSLQAGFRDTLNGMEIWARARQGAAYSPWRRIAAGDASDALAATGTQVEFTTFPDWATNVVVTLDEVVLSAPAVITVQLRQTALGVVTSGYYGSRGRFITGSQFAQAESTAAFSLLTDVPSGSTAVDGEVVMRRLGASNRWQVNGYGGRRSDGGQWSFSGGVLLTNRISGLRFATTAGTFTFGNFWWRAF